MIEPPTLMALLAVIADETWVEVNAPDGHAVVWMADWTGGDAEAAGKLKSFYGRSVLDVSIGRRRNPEPGVGGKAAVDMVVIAVDAQQKL